MLQVGLCLRRWPRGLYPHVFGDFNPPPPPAKVKLILGRLQRQQAEPRAHLAVAVQHAVLDPPALRLEQLDKAGRILGYAESEDFGQWHPSARNSAAAIPAGAGSVSRSRQPPHAEFRLRLALVLEPPQGGIDRGINHLAVVGQVVFGTSDFQLLG